jgi:outer membrane protein assembly factor BamB
MTVRPSLEVEFQIGRRSGATLRRLTTRAAVVGLIAIAAVVLRAESSIPSQQTHDRPRTAAAGQKPTAGARAATPTTKPSTAAHSTPPEPWRTWGGPRSNFTSTTTGIASTWPAGGPRRLWTRTLGDGYSGISAESGVLYTAYRRDSNDVVIAMEEGSGKTLWETAYAAPFSNAGGSGIAAGPYAMPQVIGNRIVMASGTGLLLSLDKRTGKIVWQHDLYGEFGGTRLGFGYSCHALPYKDSLIVLIGGSTGLISRLTGGSGAAAAAFKQSDGAVVWQNLSFQNAYSSPILITVDGQPQVVALVAQEVVGFSPDNGTELWRHPHPTPYGLAISTPVWGPDNILFVSSAYGGGSRGIHLQQSGGTTSVRELWANPKLQLHFGTAIRIGDYVYFSDAYNGPALVTALNVKSGQTAWQRRGFAKAQLLLADGKLILLDEDGTLALATATPQNLEVHSQVALLEKTAWTPLTMVGTRLYVRDRTSIVALDLAAPGA